MGKLITNLMTFYDGAVSYTELRYMPAPELVDLLGQTERIAAEQERAMKRGR